MKTNDISDNIILEIAKKNSQSKGIEFDLIKYRIDCDKAVVELINKLSKRKKKDN